MKGEQPKLYHYHTKDKSYYRMIQMGIPWDKYDKTIYECMDADCDCKIKIPGVPK